MLPIIFVVFYWAWDQKDVISLEFLTIALHFARVFDTFPLFPTCFTEEIPKSTPKGGWGNRKTRAKHILLRFTCVLPCFWPSEQGGPQQGKGVGG